MFACGGRGKSIVGWMAHYEWVCQGAYLLDSFCGVQNPPAGSSIPICSHLHQWPQHRGKKDLNLKCHSFMCQVQMLNWNRAGKKRGSERDGVENRRTLEKMGQVTSQGMKAVLIIPRTEPYSAQRKVSTLKRLSRVRKMVTERLA